MGLFLCGVAGPDYRRKDAVAAIHLAVAVDLPIGVAAHAGIAFVGSAPVIACKSCRSSSHWLSYVNPFTRSLSEDSTYG